MYKLNLRGLKDEGYEVDFLHGYCQYLAIVMAEEYGTKVGLWIDYDDEIEKEVLVHSFVVLRDGLYMDASGIFRSIEEVEENFDYYDTDIGIVDIETAKKILRKLRVPYGDKRIKDFVRKRVREKEFIAEKKDMIDIEDVFILSFCFYKSGGLSTISKLRISLVNVLYHMINSRPLLVPYYFKEGVINQIISSIVSILTCDTVNDNDLINTRISLCIINSRLTNDPDRYINLTPLVESISHALSVYGIEK